MKRFDRYCQREGEVELFDKIKFRNYKFDEVEEHDASQERRLSAKRVHSHSPVHVSKANRCDEGQLHNQRYTDADLILKVGR